MSVYREEQGNWHLLQLRNKQHYQCEPCELCVSGVNISNTRTLLHNTPLSSLTSTSANCRSRNTIYSANNNNENNSKKKRDNNKLRERAVLFAHTSHAKHIIEYIRRSYMIQLDEIHIRSELQQNEGANRLQLTQLFYNVLLSSLMPLRRPESATREAAAVNPCNTLSFQQTCTHDINENICNTSKENKLIHEQVLTEASRIRKIFNIVKAERPATNSCKTREQCMETSPKLLSRKGNYKNSSLTASPETLLKPSPDFLSSSSELPLLTVPQTENAVHSKQFARPATAYVRDSELLRALHNAENCLLALQSSHDNITAETTTTAPHVPFRCLSAQLEVIKEREEEIQKQMWEKQ